jgi:hypothetical protein
MAAATSEANMKKRNLIISLFLFMNMVTATAAEVQRPGAEEIDRRRAEASAQQIEEAERDRLRKEHEERNDSNNGGCGPYADTEKSDAGSNGPEDDYRTYTGGLRCALPPR